jgi:hypothetical protein
LVTAPKLSSDGLLSGSSPTPAPPTVRSTSQLEEQERGDPKHDLLAGLSARGLGVEVVVFVTGPWPVGPSFQEGSGSLAMLGNAAANKATAIAADRVLQSPVVTAAPSFREWVCRSATHRPNGLVPVRSSLVGCRDRMRGIARVSAPARRSTGREDRGTDRRPHASQLGHELLRLERDPAPGAALGRPHRGSSFVRDSADYNLVVAQALAPASGTEASGGDHDAGSRQVLVRKRLLL